MQITDEKEFILVDKGVELMNIESNYKTNEIQGSFWKPDDYMKSVPNPHVVGKENSGSNVIEVKNDSKADVSDEKNVVYSSVDGRVRLVTPDSIDYRV